jgi:hypothetical protein
VLAKNLKKGGKADRKCLRRANRVRPWNILKVRPESLCYLDLGTLLRLFK